LLGRSVGESKADIKKKKARLNFTSNYDKSDDQQRIYIYKSSKMGDEGEEIKPN